VATVLDPNGKLSITLSYGKLWSRSLKIAYALLNKIGLSGGGNKDTGGGSAGSGGGGGGVSQVKPGDRIALVYPNNDPLNMICAFYGCVMAGAVPVPIEVPMTRRDAGSAQIGFLLGSCGVSLALTSEACFKGLPKAANGEVLQFKAGWQKSPKYKTLVDGRFSF
jgi:acyl-CoA synthetase (AMP-forming)/AMP-acid ligase II